MECSIIMYPGSRGPNTEGGRDTHTKENPKAKRRASDLGRWKSHFHVINLASVHTCRAYKNHCYIRCSWWCLGTSLRNQSETRFKIWTKYWHGSEILNGRGQRLFSSFNHQRVCAPLQMGNEANVKWSVQAEKQTNKQNRQKRQFQEQNGHHLLNSHGVWFSFVINFESGDTCMTCWLYWLWKPRAHFISSRASRGKGDGPKLLRNMCQSYTCHGKSCTRIKVVWKVSISGNSLTPLITLVSFQLLK